MSTRRSQPPRSRKSRRPEASPAEVVVKMPPDPAPVQVTIREATPPVDDEMAALDAGWD